VEAILLRCLAPSQVAVLEEGFMGTPSARLALWVLGLAASAGAACGQGGSPEPTATPGDGECPLEHELCSFGDRVADWVSAGDVASIVEASTFADVSGRSVVTGAIATALGQSPAPRNATIGCPVPADVSRCDRGLVLALTTLDPGQTDPGGGQLLVFGFAREGARFVFTRAGVVETRESRAAALSGGLVTDCTLPVGLQPTSELEECLPLDFKPR